MVLLITDRCSLPMPAGEKEGGNVKCREGRSVRYNETSLSDRHSQPINDCHL